MTGAPAPAPAAELVGELTARAQTVATVESLTGGAVAAAVVDVPGASAAFRGGLVVYATDLKTSLAEVPADLLAAYGPVDPRVAVALARGGRRACHADWAVATTGVAGPGPQDGISPGTVFVSVAGPGGQAWVRSPRLSGDRAAVREGAVVVSLSLLVAAVRGRAGAAECHRG